MKTAISHTAIVILAAGASSRMGTPKQLLLYNGKTLLRHAVDTALATGCPSVFVVLGARMSLLRNELKDKPVMIVENAGWEEGMAASIRYVLKDITGGVLRPESVIFMVCDQPFVTSAVLLSLVEKSKQTGMPVVASSYGEQTGTPALFHKSFFPALMELKGDTGARKLIREHPEKVATVAFPEGIIDIDTAADYETLNKGEGT